MAASDDMLALLGELIAFDTVNPTGDERALCDHLAPKLRALGADHVEVVDVARQRGRCAYVLARFGTPELLINVHIDTVPANTGWTRPPHTATREGNQIFGLGTADIKGAVAAIMTALGEVTPNNVAVLFSGDEERGSRAIEHFVSTDTARTLTHAIVCEPTTRRGVVAHRGVLAYQLSVHGRGGHSSNADTMPKPLVTMAKLAVAIDELGNSYLSRGPEGMQGLCTNVARIEGGVAFNVVPDDASLTFSIRPYPDFDRDAYEAALFAAIARIDASVTVENLTNHAPFSALDPSHWQQLLGGHVESIGHVQFWTEAAVLSRAGINAVVVGPGDIAQAHAPDEFVTIEDLEWARGLFIDIFRRTTGQ